jgi:hypothetical protein
MRRSRPLDDDDGEQRERRDGREQAEEREVPTRPRVT